MEIVGTLFLAYLIGSIPFGLALCKLFGYGDIRKIGSGNIGATNVLRTGNKPLALVTLLLDGGKGAAAVFLLGLFFTTSPVLTALFAILGHCFPVWLKFKGGKGVATTLGTLLVAVPYAGLTACITWLASALIFRISSLAALLAMAAAPITAYFAYGAIPASITLLISTLVWARHKENIQRLLKGEEPKITNKK